MCYYDRTRYTCSHVQWSEVKQFCQKARTEIGVARSAQIPCGEKRVWKHVYPSHGRHCPQCNPVPFVWPAKENPFPALRKICDIDDCFLPALHVGPHESWHRCPADACHLLAGHDGAHRDVVIDSRTATMRFENAQREAEQLYKALNDVVLKAMGIAVALPSLENPSIAPPYNHPKPVPRLTAQQRVQNYNAQRREPRAISHKQTKTFDLCDPLYRELELSSQEIRLFELFPATRGKGVEGSFRYVTLSLFGSYTALSYTWGDPNDIREITIQREDTNETTTLHVGKNLWDFLRQQSSVISQPKVFWIDAICINQSNVHERNHQVNLMKKIYTGASEVCAWLGTESSNSDIAMNYIKNNGARRLRSKGPGFGKIWTREEGRAIRDLCERPYWKRMWIVQEIVHAKHISVWCGSKSFTWDVFERLYLKLQTLEDTHWFSHHEFAIDVLQGSAATMIWQRAHWKHPDTPKPSLRTLIEVFRNWQCADIRDKVFALVSMAKPDTAVAPDYSLSATDVYFAVRDKHPEAGWQFENMLSQVLGLSGRKVRLSRQDLIEYKVQPPDRFLLRRRMDDDW